MLHATLTRILTARLRSTAGEETPGNSGAPTLPADADDFSRNSDKSRYLPKNFIAVTDYSTQIGIIFFKLSLFISLTIPTQK